MSDQAANSFNLPWLEWISIPAGRVTLEMGWDGQGGDYTKNYSREPLGTYVVDNFLISKYPVTNQQYQMFIKDNGYETDQWWQELAERYKRPGPYEAIENHPRGAVTWYEAIAFCRWLSSKLGQDVMLPTEQQWQRAAQGDDGREYPWGNIFDPGLCNTWESHNHGSTPVDRYPNGHSPFGVFDMSGNVYEWCLNDYFNPANTGITGVSERATRGGNYMFRYDHAHISYRPFSRPNYRVLSIGFRVVMYINSP